MAPVTSPQNPTIKLIRSLSEKKFRQETGLFVAEGWDMLDRARKAGWVPEHLVSTEPISAWGETQPILVTEKIMEGLSGQNNPQSALATFKQRYVSEVTPKGVWVALEDMRDPGNLGTIIRTADAVAASGVILVGQSCDPYSRRLRARHHGFHFWRSAGAHGNRGLHRVCAKPGPAMWWAPTSRATEDFRRAYKSPTLLVMGSERRGLSEELAAAATPWCAFPCPAGRNRSMWPLLRR